MTIQLDSPAFSKSKKVLQDALNFSPRQVEFYNPSIFTNQSSFTAATIAKGDSFPVVMDPPKRSRFATLTRREDGVFSVS